MIGIYKIENLITGKIYIGSSLNIEKRFLRHKNELIKKRHVNIHLQREFNKYGIECLIFKILEECNKERLKEIEQLYLDNIFSDTNHYLYYYNIGKNSSGGDNLTLHPNREEIINKIKNGSIVRYYLETQDDKEKRRERLLGENNPNFGKRWSDDKRKKCHYTEQDLHQK